MLTLPFYGEFDRKHLAVKATSSIVILRLFEVEAYAVRYKGRSGQLVIVDPQDGYSYPQDVCDFRRQYEWQFVEDIVAGRFGRMEQLHVSAHVGIALFYLGVLKGEQLLWADVHSDRIDIRNVRIWGRQVMIRVLPDVEQAVVTADGYGIPLAA